MLAFPWALCRYVMKRVRLARQTDWQRKASFQEMELVRGLACPRPWCGLCDT